MARRMRPKRDLTMVRHSAYTPNKSINVIIYKAILVSDVESECPAIRSKRVRPFVPHNFMLFMQKTSHVATVMACVRMAK